ncbi:crossover junction endodeoxyribonuclease RuvC [Candidatus Uhrbacteria bacterium]|nr:crossover junction endodeoxyribonuclease RuvC [Candidatus Uhrbacteria bacterium]
MRVIGFDPGYGRLGFAVVEAGKALGFGVITTPKERAAAERLAEIAADVRTLMKQYRPERMAIETLFFSKNVTTGLKVAEVRGVLLMLAAEAGLEVVEVKPNEVKMALTGYGRADKRQMQEMVRTVFKLKKAPKVDDAADALAIAWSAADR